MKTRPQEQSSQGRAELTFEKANGLSTMPDVHIQVLGIPIRVRSADRDLLGLIACSIGDPIDRADPTLDYEVGRNGSTSFYFRKVSTLPAKTVYSLDHLLQTVEHAIVVAVQRGRPDLFFVHGAVVDLKGKLWIIVGESGAGKSTTAWGLLHHGFGYMSDELAPVDPSTFEVHPFPKAIHLKDSPPEPYGLPSGTVHTDHFRIPIGCLPGPIVDEPRGLAGLLFIERSRAETAPELTRLKSAESSMRLLSQGLNLLAHSRSGLDIAVRIASHAPAFQFRFFNLEPACSFLRERLACVE